MNDTLTKENVRNIQGKQRIRWTEVVLCVLAFIFSRVGIEGQFYTIGIAYIGSIQLNRYRSRWMTIFGILGILSLSQFEVHTFKYIFMYIFIQMIREYLGGMRQERGLRYQLISMGIVVGCVNLLAGAVTGLNIYRVGVSLFEALIAILAGYVLGFGIQVIKEHRDTPLTTKEAISMIMILACTLAGFVDFYFSVPYFVEIYFRDIAIFTTIIAVVYLGGLNIGGTMSMVTSSILVTIGYLQPHMVGIYGIVAITGGIFLPIGRIAVIIGGAIGQIIGFIIFNESQLDYSLVGAYLIAGVISMVLPKTYFGMAKWFGDKSLVESEQLHLERIQHILTRRINHIVNGFEKLGTSFKHKEEIKLDYDQKDIQTIIEDTGERVCKHCSMCPYCWGQDIENTYRYVYEIIDKIKQKGVITVGDIPEKFNAHCMQAESFVYCIGYQMDLIKQDIMWQNRFLENRALVAEELYAISDTLKGVIKEVDEELYFNKEEEKVLREQLLGARVKVKDVIVVESKGKSNHIDIYTKYCGKQSGYVEGIESIIKDTLGYKVYLERHICSKEQGCYLRFNIKDLYRITAGCAISAKEEISGDVHSFMEISDNQYLLALADGMGSGQIAYEESAAAIEMLEDFVGSGFKNDLAVKMINAALILKSTDEVFSSIDITLIDKRTGIAEFLKAGAATSFILRNKEVLTVKASTLPVGMIREVELQIKREQLQDNDVLIMVTDGILQTNEDVLGKEETFKYFIKEAGAGNPQYIADYLMAKSKQLLGVECKDDMTIIVARIWKQH